MSASNRPSVRPPYHFQVDIFPRGMPIGYEKIRDALIAKGKSEEEAKNMAAAIWNKHHKDNPVTNKPHRKSRKELSILGEPTNQIGDSIVLLGVGDLIAQREFTAAEALLAKRLGRKLTPLVNPTSTQDRRPLIAPLTKHRTLPNPNPNAPSPVNSVDAAVDPAPDLQSILDFLKKRKPRTLG